MTLGITACAEFQEKGQISSPRPQDGVTTPPDNTELPLFKCTQLWFLSRLYDWLLGTMLLTEHLSCHFLPASHEVSSGSWKLMLYKSIRYKFSKSIKCKCALTSTGLQANMANYFCPDRAATKGKSLVCLCLSVIRLCPPTLVPTAGVIILLFWNSSKHFLPCIFIAPFSLWGSGHWQVAVWVTLHRCGHYG